MSVLTCKLQDALESRLADLAGRRGVPNSVLVREAIESKIAEEAAAPRRPPANLIEALGDSVGSIVSGKRDLARNKKHLQRPCRRPRAPRRCRGLWRCRHLRCGRQGACRVSC